jgi:outer membrane lipoprotein-sorting protein
MTSSLRRRVFWSVPAVTAVAVTAGYLLPSTASATNHPVLPKRSAAQLLAAVQTSAVQHLSGTVVETARLGLPSLPGSDSAAALSWQTLVTGTHTARLWLDGPDRQRVALLGQLSESDVVHNGRDVWTYASDARTVGHTVLPADATKRANTHDLHGYTPQGAAAQALKAIDPSTAVSVDRTARVAGQPVYTLVLTPRDSRSTVRRVLIAIDAAHSVPLRVQVYGAAAKPAFETGFTDVSFARPAASVFRFTPPKGAKVTRDLLGTMPEQQDHQDATGPQSAQPKVLGTGWTSVLAVPATKDGRSSVAGLNGSVLDKVTTTLPNGDRLVRTALVNVLLARDGRVFVGAVAPAVLQQAAAGHVG